MTTNTINMNLRKEEEDKRKILLICIRKTFLLEIGSDFESKRGKKLYKICTYWYKFYTTK